MESKSLKGIPIVFVTNYKFFFSFFFRPKDPKLKSFISQTAGKVIDDIPHEAPKCPQIHNALHKALVQSYQNLKPIGKRLLIVIDATSKMNEKCLHNKNITGYEAAALIVASLIRSEKNLIVYCYTDQSVVQIQVDKSK